MKLTTVLLATLFILCAFAILPSVAVILTKYFGLPVYKNPFFGVLGLVCMAVWGILLSYCSNLFRRFGRGTPVPTDPPKNLVGEGIYKYSRNPIYIAYFSGVLGMAFALGHSLLFVYFGLFVLGFHCFVVFVEEPALKKRFGESYIQYCKVTPRWVIL